MDKKRNSSFVWAVIASCVFSTTIQAQNAGDTVTTNIVLAKDIVTDSSTTSGLNVGADNITIDGNGHSIICSVSSYSGRGIDVGGYSNVTIKNVRISGFFYGIQAKNNGSGLVVENCRLTSNQISGISLSSVTNVKVTNCLIREPGSAFEISGATVTISGNTIIGSRSGLLVYGSGLPPGSVLNNRFLHQLDDPPPHTQRRRMIDFGTVRRQVSVGNQVDFSLNLSTLSGESTSGLNCTVRVIPETSLTYARNKNTVSGSFKPERNGVYSILASVTDTYGNSEERAAKVFVGPMAPSRNVVYYLHDYSDGPVRGQSVIHTDNAGMKLAKPTKALGETYCSHWVDWYADDLPPPPAALVQRVDVKAMLKFLSGSNFEPIIGINRQIQANNPTVKVSIPDALGTGKVEWGEFQLSPMNWIMEYPEEWYGMTLTFRAQSLSIHSGDPTKYGQPADHYSRTIFHYTTTASPEVRALSDHRLLLLSATAAPQSAGSEQLTVWGHDNSAELVLGDFRRPIIAVSTLINAAGEARFNSGVVQGEKTFTAVPLDVSPTAGALRIEIGTWNTSGEERREWTEQAEGVPGAVTHTLGGLSLQTDYLVTVGGNELLKGRPDAQGKLSFVYTGSFPATFVVTVAPENQPPVAAFTATPNTGTAALEVQFDASSSSDDSGIITYTWDFGDGSNGSGVKPRHSFTLQGNYTVTLTVSDADGATHSASQSISVQSASSGGEWAYTNLREMSGYNASYSLGTEFSITVPIRITAIEITGLLNGQTNNIGLWKAGVTTPLARFSASTGSATKEVTVPVDVTLVPGTYRLAGSFKRYRYTPVSELQVASDITVRGGVYVSGTSLAYPQIFYAKNLYGHVNFKYEVDKDPKVNAPPSASFTASPDNGNAPLPVNFNAEASSDDVGIQSYVWNFGDGSNATGVNQNHTFTTAGVYTVTLTVTDGGGLSNSTSRSIQVLQNSPTIDSGPTATPNPAEIGQTVAFHVGATDADNDTLTYTWMFGDGTAGNGTDPSHTYSTAGVFTVNVTVTDGNGGSASASLDVTVVDIIGPQLNVNTIVLRGEVSDGSGVASLTVEGTSVPVNADGTWSKEITLSGNSTSVNLEATDGAGNISSRTITVTR